MSIKENQLAFVGGCVLLGMVAASVLLGNSLVTFKKYDQQKIDVTGAASKLITSNYATWQGRVTCRSKTMSDAYAHLKGDTGKVRTFLIHHGVDAKTIENAPISTNTLYVKDSRGDNTNQVEGFEMTQAVRFSANDVAKIDSISKESNELLTQGLSFTSDAPEYFYTKLDDLKVQMLGQATENAKQRAESMAQSTGNTIGLMRSAQMGVFQITDPNSTEVSDMGINDTQSIQKKVMAVVNVSFEVR